MKKYYYLLLVALCTFFVSCGGNSPKTVAEKFAKAYLVNHDVKEFTKFLDTRTREALLDPIMAEYHLEQQAIVKELKLKYTVNKEKSFVNEAGAAIYFDITSDTDPNYKKCQYVDLKKDLDGKWFVDLYTFPTRF
ncbi:hypothetical protein [Bacteroides sp. 519]|uniref:hypothetical protein n=1 Tax=Bacteroides sp. 519 TaxID=2302937 RepID=UPI0013D04A70|nr:hypothetical protein [Bacteroides sp. 519]NDV57273.1 hypothetical protein [Bacteroides sp. 519]